MIGLPCRAVQCSVGAVTSRLLVLLAAASITRTFALSSSPRPPTVTTRSPGSTPETTCTRSSSFTPISTGWSCATSLASTTLTIVPPSSLGSTAAAGISTAPSIVSATIATCTDVPARSRSPGLGACTHTCTVVLFGVDRGADDGHLAGHRIAAAGRRQRRLVAHLHVLRLLLGHVHARDDRRHVHHGQQRRPGIGHLARIDRPVGDDAGERAPHLGVRDLRLRRLVLPLGGFHLRGGRLDLLALAHVLQRLQVLLGGVELPLRLRVARPRLVDLPPGRARPP